MNISYLPFTEKSIKYHGCYMNNNTINTALTAWSKSNDVACFSPASHTPLREKPMFTIEDRCNNPGTDTHWWNDLDPQTYLKEVHPEIIKKQNKNKTKHQPQKSLQSQPSDLLKVTLNNNKKNAISSRTYKLLASFDNTISIPIDKWAVDINNLPTKFRWQKICNTFSVTCNSKTQPIPK